MRWKCYETLHSTSRNVAPLALDLSDKPDQIITKLVFLCMGFRKQSTNIVEWRGRNKRKRQIPSRFVSQATKTSEALFLFNKVKLHTYNTKMF